MQIYYAAIRKCPGGESKWKCYPLFIILVVLFIASGVLVAVLQDGANNIESKLKRIHQEVVDSVVRETSRLESSEYDFIDTITSRVPGELGILKRFECTSIHSAFFKGTAVLAIGCIGSDIPIDATNINPLVEAYFLSEGITLILKYQSMRSALPFPRASLVAVRGKL